MPPFCAAGDYGFDPLRIGGNADLLPYYREAELMNGRWAMAAVAGILFTDAFGLGNWWEAGTKEYALPTTTLVAIEVAVMAVLEAKRIEGFKKTGEVRQSCEAKCSRVVARFRFRALRQKADLVIKSVRLASWDLSLSTPWA